MPIRFLNVPGSTNLRSSRPTGYKFPTGISGLANTTVEYLVVAGGGGAGGTGAGGYGGAGAGGFLTASGFTLTVSTPYSITVGAGGPGASGSGAQGSNGSNSIFSSVSVRGGGRGGVSGTPVGTMNGGSGGGTGSQPNPAGVGESGQGTNGGLGFSDFATVGVGGGLKSITCVFEISTAGLHRGRGHVDIQGTQQYVFDSAAAEFHIVGYAATIGSHSHVVGRSRGFYVIFNQFVGHFEPDVGYAHGIELFHK